MMRGILVAAVSAAVPVFALAQSVGNGSNYQTPSAPNYTTPTVPPTPDYRLPQLPDAGIDAAEPAGGAPVFVKRIEVRGVKAFKPAAIAALVAPYENRTVTSGELQALRVALTRLYVDKGYINSGALLLNQQSSDGVVVFQAIEGTLARIDVGGKGHLSSNYVSARIRDHIDDPLNITDLQAALRYLQQDPNIARLDARLSPGDALGRGVLRVDVDEQPRFSAGLGYDNHHASSTGGNEGTAFFGVRDLTGYGEDIRASAVRTDGDTEGSAVLNVPVSARNAALQLYYSRASALIVEQPFQPLNIKDSTRTYGLSLTEPVLDHLNDRFSLFVGGESDRSSTELLGTPFSFSPGAQNGISAVTAVLGGLDWLLHGASSVLDLRLTYRRGIDALGATINSPATDQLFNPNPTGADGRFGLEQMQFIFVQRLDGFPAFAHVNDRAQFIIRASGQYSQQPLLTLEKFTVGGVDTVRGYSENLLVRDDGTAATIELQLPLPGYRAIPDPRDLVFAVFSDYGRSWDKVDTAIGNPLLNTTDPLYIASAGLGLLWNPLRGLDAQVYWGKGIANNFTRADDPRNFVPDDLQKHGVHFAVNYVARW
jgi:hemolysin activation/secretion protein